MTKTMAQRIREDLDEREVPDEVKAFLRAWLDADAAFNTWFLETTKGSVDDETLFGLLGAYGETQDMVESAWRDYLDAPSDSAQLEATLAASRTKMAALRERER